MKTWIGLPEEDGGIPVLIVLESQNHHFTFIDTLGRKEEAILSIDQVVCSNTKGFCLKTPEVASKETAIPRKVTPAIPIALLSHAGCQRLSKICQDRV